MENKIPGVTLIARDIFGQETNIQLPEPDRKVCQNTLVLNLMKAEKKAKKKRLK